MEVETNYAPPSPTTHSWGSSSQRTHYGLLKLSLRGSNFNVLGLYDTDRNIAKVKQSDNNRKWSTVILVIIIIVWANMVDYLIPTRHNNSPIRFKSLEFWLLFERPLTTSCIASAVKLCWVGTPIYIEVNVKSMRFCSLCILQCMRYYSKYYSKERKFVKYWNKSYTMVSLDSRPLSIECMRYYSKYYSKERKFVKYWNKSYTMVSLDSRPLSIEKDGLVYTVCACVVCPKNLGDRDILVN